MCRHRPLPGFNPRLQPWEYHHRENGFSQSPPPYIQNFPKNVYTLPQMFAFDDESADYLSMLLLIQFYFH